MAAYATARHPICGTARLGPLSEICKHAGVAVVVLAISKALGLLVRVMMGPG
jgi:hypothetical protein